jgi:2-methylcitrate dehydratase PrpD
MTAVLLAYDVECRISMALTSTRQYQRSFHPSSVCGTFGAMTAAGRLMGLDKPQLTNAFGLAGCQASGLQAWATEMEHFTKSFQTGIAARNGVTAAILARDGYQGPPDILEGRHNVFDAFSGVRNFQELTRGLGEEYEIMMTSLKQYSACRFLHAPLDALLDILAANDLEVDNIDTITAEVCEYGKPQIDRNELITHNAQYVLAAAAYRRRLGMDEYSTECRNDPRIRDLASRVYVEGNSELEQLYPERWAAIVHVKMKDGREFSKRVDFAKGDPQNPMTWEEVVSKFVSLAGPVISEAKAEAVVELVSGLETLDDTRELVKLLRLG